MQLRIHATFSISQRIRGTPLLTLLSAAYYCHTSCTLAITHVTSIGTTKCITGLIFSMYNVVLAKLLEPW
jgi:hypothetical protein